MKTATTTMTTTILYSEDMRYRYLLRKVWDESKPMVTIIMLSAGTSDTVSVDTTTMLTVNNLHKLNYGGVNLLNLYANSDRETNSENDTIILENVKDSETVILAWGLGCATSAAVQKRIAQLLELLEPHLNRCYALKGKTDKVGLHPLAPSLRHDWVLVKWQEEEALKVEDNSKRRKQK